MEFNACTQKKRLGRRRVPQKDIFKKIKGPIILTKCDKSVLYFCIL